jgi:alkanesulfonate monooxygenase SsuD/methylene tetrahydromethanopterin reductase-like flavin-dependent oxidoreductase (luciferase family)
MNSYLPNPALRFGLVLPSKGPHAGPDSLDAAASVCTELGWSSVWVTDHLMVPSGPEAEEYGSILEALSALTWVAARHEQLKIGTSVLVPAMRDAPLLAKQLATIDVLTKGRLVVGVGVSDAYDEIEYANLGKLDRFRQRGAYLDEAIALWRHLWSGNKDPFEGTFNTLRDYSFEPLPPQGAAIPILCGGRSPRAIRRTVELADGYHAAQTGPVQLKEKIPDILEGVALTGRKLPELSVRVRIEFDQAEREVYTICGTHEKMIDQLLQFAALGVADLVFVLEKSEASQITDLANRLAEYVIKPFHARVDDYLAAVAGRDPSGV